MIAGIFNSLRKTDGESKKIGLEGSFGPSFHPKAGSAIPKFVLTVFFYPFLENVQ